MKLQDLQYGYNQLVNNQTIIAQKSYVKHKMTKEDKSRYIAYYRLSQKIDDIFDQVNVQELIRYESWLNGGEY